jgi:regulation of enolase protein 1 (concanavalin A-like superfamily)
MDWLNPPAGVEAGDGALVVTTGPESDFWRGTFYGFSHHNGHALLAAAPEEFTAEVWFEADYAQQYDQAGLMIHADEAHWVKGGIEFVGGKPHVAAVVTNGHSDWSQMPLAALDGPFGLRMTRMGDAVWVQYATRPGEDWALVRLAYLQTGLAYRAGPMACSPSRKDGGLVVRFSVFRLGPPASPKPY